MMPLRQSRWISTFLVSVIAFAWIVASNHCALAAFEGAGKIGHACCPEKKSNLPQPQSTMQCCNSFHVAMPTHAVVPAAQLHALPPAWLEASYTPSVEIAQGCAAFPATGPPRVFGFAETVLNRSLLAHAPPFFVA